MSHISQETVKHVKILLVGSEATSNEAASETQTGEPCRLVKVLLIHIQCQFTLELRCLQSLRCQSLTSGWYKGFIGREEGGGETDKRA